MKAQKPQRELENRRLMIRVAKMYYEDDLTQAEIAKKLGYSRVKINRTLKQARETGVVRISIEATEDYELEHALAEKYSLRDVVVVPTEANQTTQYMALSQGTTDWLNEHMEPGMGIGLGLGRTISHLPLTFNPEKKGDYLFVEVVGAASDHARGVTAYNVASRMAEICGGHSELFYAPTYVTDPDLRSKLLREPTVAKALERARNCDIVLQSIGPATDEASLYVHGFLSAEELHEIQKTPAVGDALGRYFDAEGNHVPTICDERMLGLDLDELRGMPWSVVVAAGESKHEVIKASLKGKVFNVAIIDTQTAQFLLKD